MQKHWGVYPNQRKDEKTGETYFVLSQHTGSGMRSCTTRYWPKALIAPRKPMRFGTYQEAMAYEKSID